MTKKIAAVAAVAALAVPAAAASTAQADPVPPCVKTVVANAPGFAVYFVTYTVNNGEPPFIGGPFLPC